jgi:hypothetical protein
MDSLLFEPEPAILSPLTNRPLSLSVSTEVRDKEERDSLDVQMVHSEIDVEGHNERGPKRTQSPYVQQSTIDFGCLSWPSR